MRRVLYPFWIPALLLVLTALLVGQTPERSRWPVSVLRDADQRPGRPAPAGILENTIKWEETFDGVTLPAGWRIVDADSSGLTDSTRAAWALVQQVTLSDNTEIFPESGQSFLFSNFLNGNDNNVIDEWVLTPALPIIEVGDSLHFYAGAIDANFKDSLAVFIGSAPSVDSMLAGTEIAYFKVDGPRGGWNRYSFSLADFAGQRVHVGVNYFHLDGGRFGNHSDHIWLDHFLLTNDSTITTSVEQRPSLAGAFELAQNYPNPFNPSTTIAYRLEQPSRVRLEVFTLLGQRISTPVPDGRQAPGRYEVIWSGQDDNGQPVASGVYYYRLTAGRFEQTRRMVLLR